ncbi:MAG: proline dehydrogenase family protein [Acidobacteria bacterium]|jgi:proline dehydrogenase|nr:proline dehydrogenase family protein [Acidobacteriota bacterium]
MSVMRKALLWASTNAWIRENAMRTGFVRRSVSKFMPGEAIEDAVQAAKALQPTQVNTILTRLGENISHIEEADEVCDHYLKVIDLITAAGIDSQISVKPTQLGYDQDFEVCVKHCLRLIDRCEETKTFFWLDMEGSPYVDGTIALFKRLRERTPNIGIAIQAYLFRTEKDIEELVALGSAIRMVKGAYLEPPDIAFPEKADVDENYFKICARLLQDDNTKPGALTHIATHDPVLQDRLMKVVADRKVSTDRYEFAMLFGITTARQKELAAQGQRTRCLISYGEFWFPWYMRRLAERPANVWFVVRNMFKG